jgi:hypothetical protein
MEFTDLLEPMFASINELLMGNQAADVRVHDEGGDMGSRPGPANVKKI